MSIVKLLNYVFPLVTIPLVSRALGVENIGLVNYIFAFGAYFVVLVSYGFNYTAIRRANDNLDLNKVFSLILTSQLFLLIGAVVIFLVAFFFVHDLFENSILSLLGFSACIATFFNKNWVFQLKADLKYIAIIDFTVRIFSCVLIIYFVKSVNDVLMYAGILSLATVLSSFLSLIVAKYKYKINVNLASVNEVFQCIKEDRNIFFSAVVVNLYTTTSIVLLGLIASNKEVGLYTTAQKVIDLIRNIMIVPLFQVFYPLISEKMSKDKEDGFNYVYQLMPIFCLIAGIIFIGVMLFGSITINILFGAQFIESIPLLYILNLGLIFQIFSMIFGLFLMVNLNMDQEFFYQQFVIAIFSIVSIILILPHGGGAAVAVVWSVCEFLVLFLQFRSLGKRGYVLIDRNIFTKQSLVNAFRLVLQRK